MLIEKENYAIYIHDDSDNLLYNRIISPNTGRIFYPDILISHSFDESFLVNEEVFRLSEQLSKKYGTSGCFFVSVKDEKELKSFSDRVWQIYSGLHNTISPDLSVMIEKLGDDLKLSFTMRSSLKDLLTYCSQIMDGPEFIRKIYSNYTLPVSQKQEGKKIYERIRKEILGATI